MVGDKERNSNIELLRIFAMLMIVAFHIYVHCINVQLTDNASMVQFNNGLFNVPLFFKKLLILQTVAPMGQIGNVIFMIISGYFMVSKGQKIDLIKVAKKLLLQQGFAAIVLTIGSMLVFWLTKDLFITLMDINIFNQMSWYVGYYFAVIVFAKLYLNKLLSRISKKQYVGFLWTMFAVTQFSWTGGVLNALASGLLVFFTGVFLYALGGYIYKYDPFATIKTPIIVVTIAVVYVLIYISFYNITITNIEKFCKDGNTEFFIQNVVGFADHYFVPIIIGISLFELFRRVFIPSRSIINFLGASTFMVYLIHDNSFFYSIWATQDWITVLYSNPIRFILKIIGWTLMTFGIGTMMYTVYLIVARIVRRSYIGVKQSK